MISSSNSQSQSLLGGKVVLDCVIKVSSESTTTTVASPTKKKQPNQELSPVETETRSRRSSSTSSREGEGRMATRRSVRFSLEKEEEGLTPSQERFNSVWDKEIQGGRQG